MVNPILLFAASVLICVGTVPELPIHNSEDLSMLAPLLVSRGVLTSLNSYLCKIPDTESHSVSAKCGSSEVIDGENPFFFC